MKRKWYLKVASVVCSVTFSALAEDVLLECERFDDLGGWTVDAQFRLEMGSTYLLAHGLGKPVSDARTSFDVPEGGRHVVWVRTKNWTGPWSSAKGAGRFQLAVNGMTLPAELGVEGKGEWRWSKAGDVDLKQGRNTVALHDLTGFDGRCDAIFFTGSSDIPASQVPRTSQVPRVFSADLTVVGGGVAGICAAISAARLGLSVALVQDRPVLGGANSSEVRVHLGGRANLGEYPRLGDVVAEIGPAKGGNAQPAGRYEDDRKLAAVKAEKNIRLFLNTQVDAVATNGEGRIVEVRGTDVIDGVVTAFRSALYADCTGDGTVGALAGADWRLGRESRAETGESLAPDEADKMILGASVQWYAHKKPQPAPFPSEPWMIAFTDENCEYNRRGDWDWETGMLRDQLKDFEFVRDYGLLVVYSNWSYIKNRGVRKDEFANDAFAWVAYVAGKRETRRLMGDHVLCQQDIFEERAHPDGTCVTTWPIDLHFPMPANQRNYQGEPFRSVCTHNSHVAYPIPYRCLYSRNVPNLFMAGRNISVTHVALGTTRVMRTHGMMGEVVGMAASLCRRHGCDPRGIYACHLADLKALMRQGVGKGHEQPPQDYNLGGLLDKDVRWLDALDLTKAIGTATGVVTAVQSTPERSLRLSGRTCGRGILMTSGRALAFESDGYVITFDAVVGVPEEVEGSCAFKVYADGQKIFDSGVRRAGDPPQEVHLYLKGTKSLVLGCEGMDGESVAAVGLWGDAKLTLDRGGLLYQVTNVTTSGRPKDALVPAAEGDARLGGAVGAKLDRFIAHRVCSAFARETVFPEARRAFEQPDDDLFYRAPDTLRPQGMWKGEFWGKLMISACRMARYAHDEKLRAFLHEETLRLIALQRPDGYLGSYSDPEYLQPIDWKEVHDKTAVKGHWCWNLWCRKYTMWGLLEAWKLTGDRRILGAVERSMDQEIGMLKRLGLHAGETGTFHGMASSSVLKPLLLLYRETDKPEYLAFAREIVEDFRRADGRAPNLLANAFSGKPLADWYEGPWAWAKAYELMSCLNGLLEYYRVTGEVCVLEAMKRVQAMIAEHETNPCFSVGYNDQFANAAHLLNGVTEPCDVIHWIRFNHDLWLLTGEPKYVDAIELGFYNAYLAGMYRDGTWGARAVRSHGYHCSVQGQSGMTHQHCCVNNMPRTIADVAQTMAAKDSEGTLYVAFYNDGVATVDGDRIEVSGNYPVGGMVTVKVFRQTPGKIRFRIPAWSARDPDRGTWRTVLVPAGETTHRLAFDLSPRIWAPRREKTTYAPPAPNGRQEWRVRGWTCYGENADLLPQMRTEPAVELLRGPLLLAKHLPAAGLEKTDADIPLDGRAPKLKLSPRSCAEVWGAWTLKIDDGKDEKEIPVCDFQSAGDDYKPDRMKFSVWF